MEKSSFFFHTLTSFIVTYFLESLPAFSKLNKLDRLRKELQKREVNQTKNDPHSCKWRSRWRGCCRCLISSQWPGIAWEVRVWRGVWSIKQHNTKKRLFSKPELSSQQFFGVALNTVHGSIISGVSPSVPSPLPPFVFSILFLKYAGAGRWTSFLTTCTWMPIKPVLQGTPGTQMSVYPKHLQGRMALQFYRFSETKMRKTVK